MTARRKIVARGAGMLSPARDVMFPARDVMFLATAPYVTPHLSYREYSQ